LSLINEALFTQSKQVWQFRSGSSSESVFGEIQAFRN